MKPSYRHLRTGAHRYKGLIEFLVRSIIYNFQSLSVKFFGFSKIFCIAGHPDRRQLQDMVICGAMKDRQQQPSHLTEAGPQTFHAKPSEKW